MARILIEGSSTAYGLWSGGEGGWADRLKQSYIGVSDRRKFASVINLAAPSKTIEQSVASLEAVAQTHAQFSSTRLGLYQLGMIESRFVDGEREMHPDRFQELLRKLGSISVSYGFSPIFIGMTPIDESRTRHILFGGKIMSYTEEERAQYDEIVREYAKENDHAYLDITTGLTKRFSSTDIIY